jgi:hypothetical protein
MCLTPYREAVQFIAKARESLNPHFSLAIGIRHSQGIIRRHPHGAFVT